MYLLGYSLNNLSLMALTIATGFVVDDAIVMIENIARYSRTASRRCAAALKGATQIGFTIISLTVSLIAVLIPLLFMGDVVGRLFREFAVTLAITILISAVVSLTLVPMMSARWLKANREDGRPRGVAGQRAGASSTGVMRRYDRVAGLGARAPGAHAGWWRWRRCVLTVLLYIVIPKGLFPTQDTGQLQGARRRPRQTSRTRAWRSCRQQAARAILADPAVANLSSIVGVDAANNTMLHTGSMLINLQARARRPAGGDGPAARARARRCAGVSCTLQPTQDLTIDAETGPTAVPRLARRRRRRRHHAVDGQAGRRGCTTRRSCATSAATPARTGLAACVDVDRDTASRLGISASCGRRRAVQRLRPAHRLDHLHRDQPVPRDPRGAARAGAGRRRRWASCNLITEQRHADAAVGVRQHHRAARAAAGHPRRRSTRRARWTSTPRPACRWATAVDAIRLAAKDIALPPSDHA